jgi:hypothetical protein
VKFEERLVESKYKFFNEVSIKKVEGMEPVIFVLLNESKVSRTKLPRYTGIVPTKELDPKSRLLRKVELPTAEGTKPVS